MPPKGPVVADLAPGPDGSRAGSAPRSSGSASGSASGSSSGSRRQQVGPASARSLLLTVLGEFVLPHDGQAWTGALVAALAELDVEEKAARQAVARTASEGWLQAERAGRRVRWSLAPSGLRLLEEGTERIYSFGREVPRWDGQWLVLAVTVPETQRQLRHRLRTRLTWAGLGSPFPGLWVTPHADKEKEVAAVVAELGIEAFSYVGRFGVIGEEQRVVGAAWSLDQLQAQYGAFAHRFARESPSGARAVFRSQVALVHAWRRFPFLDPALPADLLPRSWPGPRSAELFLRRHQEWHTEAQQHWARLSQRADSST